MKLTEMKPNTLYAATNSDYNAAMHRRSDYIVRTGDPLAFGTRSHAKAVELLPFDGDLTDTGFIGTRGPEWRRGLSIGQEIGPVADWPKIRDGIVEARRAERETQRARREQQEAAAAALDAGNRWLANLLGAGRYFNSGLTVDQLDWLRLIVEAADGLADAVALANAGCADDTGAALSAYRSARKVAQSISITEARREP